MDREKDPKFQKQNFRAEVCKLWPIGQMWPQLVLCDLKTIKMVSTFVKHWGKKKKKICDP